MWFSILYFFLTVFYYLIDLEDFIDLSSGIYLTLFSGFDIFVLSVGFSSNTISTLKKLERE